MGRIYLPSTGADAWQGLLAQPEKHWKTGFSARSAAHAWEAGNGLPTEIAALLQPHLGATELLIAIPEHKVPLPGSSRGDSQSDIFALVRGESQTAACTIEAKVSEPFDMPLSEWLSGASPGKLTRLTAILSLLGLAEPPPNIRYQLLQRTAAALIEADRFLTGMAAMIVHSYSPEHRWFEDFEAFVSLFGEAVAPGTSVCVNTPSGRPLILGWAIGDQRFRSM